MLSWTTRASLPKRSNPYFQFGFQGERWSPLLQTAHPAGDGPVGSWDCRSLRIGCPVWNCPGWSDVVYPARTPAPQRLAWYSQMFPTVEGNSTFYALTPLSTLEHWCDATPSGFRFCFKFPQAISHTAQLAVDQKALQPWFRWIEQTARKDRLGPSLLQLGPSFSSRSWTILESFLKQLPKEFPWAVELRHPDWFDGEHWEPRVDQLLSELGIDRVHLDATWLYSRPPETECERVASAKKPKVTVRHQTPGQNPMLRLVGRDHAEGLEDAWGPWVQTICTWMLEGKKPWVFTHAPDDRQAPHLARRLFLLIESHLSTLVGQEAIGHLMNRLGRLPAASQSSTHRLRQPSLFDRWEIAPSSPGGPGERE